MKLSSYIPFYLLTLAEAKFYLIDTSGDYGLAKPIEENDSWIDSKIRIQGYPDI